MQFEENSKICIEIIEKLGSLAKLFSVAINLMETQQAARTIRNCYFSAYLAHSKQRNFWHFA